MRQLLVPKSVNGIVAANQATSEFVDFCQFESGENCAARPTRNENACCYPGDLPETAYVIGGYRNWFVYQANRGIYPSIISDSTHRRGPRSRRHPEPRRSGVPTHIRERRRFPDHQYDSRTGFARHTNRPPRSWRPLNTYSVGRKTESLMDNVNALIPTIAIQRLDIVADGSAAAYGNEAVAGVVNFVPYTSYDGFRIESYAEGDTRGDYDEHSVQMLWGGDIGDINVVLAGQFRQNSRLAWNERNILANSGLVISSNAPGNWFVLIATRMATYGQSWGAADPSCTPGSERTDYTPGVASNAYGMRLGTSCFFDFGDQRSAREPAEFSQLFANVTYDVNDDLTLSFQGVTSRVFERTYTSTSNPGNSRIGELPAVRGEMPGNPFRACRGGRFDRFNPFVCSDPADNLSALISTGTEYRIAVPLT